jgi:hypothetical protein
LGGLRDTGCQDQFTKSITEAGVIVTEIVNEWKYHERQKRAPERELFIIV